MALEETAAIVAELVTHLLSLEAEENDEADEALRVLMAAFRAAIDAAEELVRQRRTAAAAAAAA
jgi:hypothetical protein